MSDSNPPSVSRETHPEAAIPACPACGLTAPELRDGGLMGCPECYAALVGLVEEAARELHGIAEGGPPAVPKPRPSPAEADHPWPTRRATSRRKAPPPEAHG